MSRLRASLMKLRTQKKKALVAYLTAGNPSLEGSVAAALAAVRAGADVLEIGVPFSDPIADGAVIQRAMGRALLAGGGFAPALEVVRRVRAETDVPIVVFGYLNPLLWDGVLASCKAMHAAGADGLLVVDLPPEESAELREAAAAVDLEWVTLVAPTTGSERARQIVQQATGFVYLVSMTGVTGGTLTNASHLQPVLEALANTVALPVCIGFGIRDRASARAAAAQADGVVVGSAIVAALEAGSTQGQGAERVGRLVAELRAGLDEER